MRLPLILAGLLACATPAFAAEPSPQASLCAGVDLFITAAAPDPARRIALFYPMEASGNGVDAFAPMDSAPHDDAADAFYDRAVAATKGPLWSRFGDDLVNCVKARGPFWSTEETLTNNNYHLRVIDPGARRAVIVDISPDACPEPLKGQMLRGADRCVRLEVRGK